MVTTLRKGTAVVDACTGALLGRVHALYLDRRRREVVGFSLRRGGVFWRALPGLIELAAVRSVDPDAVAVSGRSAYGVLGRDPEGAGMIALDDLTRRPVRLEDGTALGRVVAVRFSVDSRGLVGLEVEPDGLPLCRMLIVAEQVVHLGPGAVVVREPAAAPSVAIPPVRVVHRGHGRRRVA